MLTWTASEAGAAPRAACREAAKHAGLGGEVDRKGARYAAPAMCGHHARKPLHKLRTLSPVSPRQDSPC